MSALSSELRDALVAAGLLRAVEAALDHAWREGWERGWSFNPGEIR